MKTISNRLLKQLAFCALWGVAAQTLAEDARQPAAMAPTLADVAYGDHPRQVLDFWRADSDGPTPVVIHMHGGGWVAGSKGPPRDLAAYLEAGISVVSINYRYVTQAKKAAIQPPVKWPMEDAARAVQLVRSRAEEWNLDPERIGGTGSSAGACTMLWLAFHDDMADPESADPVARASTRLWCVAVNDAQTSLDPRQMKEWIPNSRYGGHAFGFPSAKGWRKNEELFADFLDRREEVLPWIMEYSPYAQASADDPPVCLVYKYVPAMGQPHKDPTHFTNFGVKLKDRLDELGVACELIYPHATGTRHKNVTEYLIDRLRQGI